MRCDNCGWSNPDGLTKCQKCNQDLVPPISVAPVAAPTSNAINQTIIDQSRHGAAFQSASTDLCPRCGYPMSPANSFCPNCGTQVNQSKPVAPQANAKTVRVLPEEFLEQPAETKPAEVPLKATVREIPVDLIENTSYAKTVRVLPEEMLSENETVQQVEPSFKLIPLDNFDGAVQGSKEFKGTPASLNRESIVSEPSYLPEDLCVEFKCEDGQWTVEDKSSSKSVFVSASRPINVQVGDIVVIGNRRFIFE